MPDFLIKLPVFQLDATTRGAVIGAKVTPAGAEVTMLRDDGQTVSMVMATARVMAAARMGPYVLLAEVKGRPGDMVRGLGLVGPRGEPL